MKYRQIIYFKNYYKDFYREQSDDVQGKMSWTVRLIQEIQQIPEKYLKHIEGTKGLYEMRVEYGSDIFRVFCCFDKGNLVVLMNGFQKKTQKTPKQEIEKALKIKAEYEQLKQM